MSKPIGPFDKQTRINDLMEPAKQTMKDALNEPLARKTMIEMHLAKMLLGA